MKQNLRKLINYSIKKESKHLVLTLDELKEIRRADKKLRKLEKVIRILNNKQVNMIILLECIKANGGVELYNACVVNPFQLTQKEYDLLNEVLKDDKQD